MTAGMLAQVPAALRRLVARHLDQVIKLVVRRDWSMGAAIEQSMLWTSGTSSVEAFLDWCGQFRLDGLEGQIRCPVLAVEQTRRFADAVAGPATVVLLPRDLGADNHVGIGNITHTAGVVFDWLADQLHATADRADRVVTAARH